MSSTRSGSDHRYIDQRPQQQLLWHYFCTEIAPQIIRSALAKSNPVNLSRLYYVLSMARKRCELLKEFVAPEYRIPFNQANMAHTWDSEIAYSPNEDDQASFFGYFNLNGSFENDYADAGSWGEEVAALAKARLQLMDCISTDDQFHLGFSCFTSSKIFHPNGIILNQAQPLFEALQKEQDFYTFLTLAAQLMHVLANFPPICRGSHAVNSSIINNLAREKFSFTFDIQPAMADWYAFYEMPAPYTIFYLIATTKQLCLSLDSLTAEHRESLALVDKLLLLNPYTLENRQIRRKLWEETLLILEETLTADGRTYMLHLLRSLTAATPFFPEPSASVSHLASLCKKLDPTTAITHDILEENLTALELLQLKKIIDFEDHICRKPSAIVNPQTDIYLQQAVLSDIDFLRSLGTQIHRKIREIFEKNPNPPISHLSYQETLEINYRQDYYVPGFNTSLFAHEFTSKYDIRLKNTKSLLFDFLIRDRKLSQDLYLAMLSGGLQLTDLAGLSIETIDLLISPAARFLYRANQHISVHTLLGDSNSDTALNIIEQVAAIRGDSLPANINYDILVLLLECAHLYELHDMKLADLIGASAIETKRHILFFSLAHFLNDTSEGEQSRHLSDQEVEQHLAVFYRVLQEASFKHHLFIRSCFAKFSLSFTELVKHHLQPEDIVKNKKTNEATILFLLKKWLGNHTSCDQQAQAFHHFQTIALETGLQQSLLDIIKIWRPKRDMKQNIISHLEFLTYLAINESIKFSDTHLSIDFSDFHVSTHHIISSQQQISHILKNMESLARGDKNFSLLIEMSKHFYVIIIFSENNISLCCADENHAYQFKRTRLPNLCDFLEDRLDMKSTKLVLHTVCQQQYGEKFVQQLQSCINRPTDTSNKSSFFINRINDGFFKDDLDEKYLEKDRKHKL